ncbi:unnamed protein product [Effrenium voratum]|nr:unnamed protein product [Effrenium voratum]
MSAKPQGPARHTTRAWGPRGSVWHKLARSSSDFRRGGFVTHTTPKLDNPTARRITNTEYLKSLATDTFRESQAAGRALAAAFSAERNVIAEQAILLALRSENFLGSKGKRTGLHKDLDVAKHLMRFEADRVAPPPPNNRRQHFQDNPQTAKHVEELRTLSPRRLRDAKRADALSPGRNTAAVDVQHRTSGEMAAAVQPDFTSPVAAAAEKYLVGCEIFDMASNGVRKGVKAKVRHHTNSDVVKEHIQPTCRHSCVMFCVASDRGNRRLGFLVKVVEESSLFYG